MPSWLGSTGEESLVDVLGHRRDYADGLARIERELWLQRAIDPAVLELCRLRIRSLLGIAVTPNDEIAGLNPRNVATLHQWPSAPSFTPHERVCLDLAEQILIDATGVTDERAEQAIEVIGRDAFVVLAYACGLFETMARADLVLGLESAVR